MGVYNPNRHYTLIGGSIITTALVIGRIAKETISLLPGLTERLYSLQQDPNPNSNGAAQLHVVQTPSGLEE